MALHLEVIAGALKGSRFKLAEGMQLGRSKGEIQIPDPKISGLHALVEKDSRGKLILVDQNSSNGLLINEIRVKRVALLPGVRFQAGKTLFKVVDYEDHKLAASAPQSWRELLMDEIPRLKLKNKDPKVSVQPFQKLVKIEILTGIQADQSFVLGFGPRIFGSDTLDIELFDIEAPNVAFQLTPDLAGVRFSTNYPEKVTLNHNQVSTDLIKAGDKIYLGQTTIQITFEE
jgi:pSer/pThr/pTyr-binding forkhead associated (FHA) protein